MPTIDTQALTLTGAKIIVKTLKKLGVDTIFGYPGGIVLSVYDELFKQNDIKHVLMRHEQAAVHAAEGYARVSGKCGVVLVTSGPGATNTVTGIANAYLDGYPLVVLTGQVQADLIGKDAFQEVNIIDMTRSCTKANFQVTEAENLQQVLEKAFYIATTGKQGPVVVDLAKNIFAESVQYRPSLCFVNNTPQCAVEDVKNALLEICSAERPVIVAGGGVVQSGASEKLLEFAKILNIPVVNTMMALGTYPQDAENYLGMIGIFGQVSANKTVRESDLVFSIGARFNDRVTCCFPNGELNRKFIQLDINSDEISRVISAYIALNGDADAVLDLMIKELKSGSYEVNSQHKSWLAKAVSFKSQNKQNHKISEKLHSFEVIEKIYEYTKNMNPIVSTEVGQHQLWTAQNFKFSAPRKFLTSGGSGTMGFGLPAAIGAWFADKKSPIICISGDGSFQMNSQELAVCVEYGIPVKIFILNNGYLGMVRQLQQKLCEGRFSETKMSNPDFVKLADAYGVLGLRVENVDEIPNALRDAFASKEAVVVNFYVEPMEIV